MLQTAWTLLRAWILKPELIQFLGDFDARGLLTPNEAVVLRAISDIWADGHPEEINSAILTTRIVGKVNDPEIFVGSLTDGKCFRWGGKMREARKFTRIWRKGAGVFCRYGRKVLCLNKLESKAEARLVLSLMKKKIEGGTGLGIYSNGKRRSDKKNKPS